jgi:16S rRNA (guanine527-N7)-methyltransferase
MPDPDLAGIADALDRLAAAIRSSPHNLVSRQAREELETRHVPECLAFARILPPGGPVLDLGSGGGLPGLVIAIARPDLEVHLLEATAKKAGFLAEVSTSLGLATQVHRGRAEELAKGPLRSRFAVVTARAVAPLHRLAVWAEPYLAPAGRLYAIKGERWAQEVDAAGTVLARLHLTVEADPSSHPQLRPSASDPQRPLVVMLARRS